jgi:hypothetical protein
MPNAVYPEFKEELLLDADKVSWTPSTGPKEGDICVLMPEGSRCRFDGTIWRTYDGPGEPTWFYLDLDWG